MLLLEEFNNLEIPIMTLSSVFLVTSDTEVEWMYEIRRQYWNCKINNWRGSGGEAVTGITAHAPKIDRCWEPGGPATC